MAFCRSSTAWSEQKQREHRHCGLLRSARVPQRGATCPATMMPGSAARSAPSGWRAGVTETAKSPRPQCQWARTTNSASRHRQEAEVSCQRITKACCSTTAGSEQKQREQRARLAHAPRAFNDLRRGLLKRVLAARAPRVTSLARCPSGQPTGVLVPRSVPRRAEVRQQWRPGAVLPTARLSTHCGPHRTTREPQRGDPRAATMMPRSAALTAPNGRRAGVTETARSPRSQ